MTLESEICRFPADHAKPDRSGALFRDAEAEIRAAKADALLEPDCLLVTKGIRLLGMTLSSLGEQQLESEPQLRLTL